MLRAKPQEAGTGRAGGQILSNVPLWLNSAAARMR